MKMPSMTTFKQGDVILVPFPFTDQTGTKKRPAVVVSADWFNSHYEDLILVPITSSIREPLEKNDLRLTYADNQMGGLPKPSIAKTQKIVTVDKRLIIKQMGRLSSGSIQEILLRVSQALKQDGGHSVTTDQQK